MNQHPSQQTSIDFLVPDQIIDYCSFDRFTMDIKLIGIPADEDHPMACIRVSDKIIFDGVIEQEENLSFETSLDLMNSDSVVLEVEYYGKEDRHTVVDQNGHIKENQMIELDKLAINDVDVIKTNILYSIGQYEMNLPEHKRQHFIDNGYEVGPTHSRQMFENGKWTINVPVPVLTGFCKITSVQDPHEKWPDPELMQEIFNRIKNIRELELKLDELS